MGQLSGLRELTIGQLTYLAVLYACLASLMPDCLQDTATGADGV